MSSLLTIVGELEKDLSLLDGILQNILIYETKDHNLISNINFNSSNNYDVMIIGGLTATINEFGGKPENYAPRSIVLENLKLIFTMFDDFLLVIAVDPTYEDAQFQELMSHLISAYTTCFDQFQAENSDIDELAIHTQIIFSLISEEIGAEFTLGEVVQIYPFKMKEIADKRSATLFGQPNLDKIITQEEIKLESQNKLPENLHDEDPELRSKNEALFHLLNKFVSTFSDALQITLVRFTPSGSLQKITAGRLEEEIEENMYEVIIGMMSEVIAMLNNTDEFRTLDLEDKWVYFQYVSQSSFLYITVENIDVLALIKPLIERISMTIANLFPDEGE